MTARPLLCRWLQGSGMRPRKTRFRFARKRRLAHRNVIGRCGRGQRSGAGRTRGQARTGLDLVSGSGEALRWVVVPRALPDKRNQTVAHARGIVVVAAELSTQDALLLYGAPRDADDEERREQKGQPGTEQ
jgi:hypothetical protein